MLKYFGLSSRLITFLLVVTICSCQQPGQLGQETDEYPNAKDLSSGTFTNVGNNGSPASAFPLGLCEGDCDNDDECKVGLKCFLRDRDELVPGCSGSPKQGDDYCYDPSGSSNELVIAGDNGNPSVAFPLGLCQGDCDNDNQCETGLLCFQRIRNEPVPGCSGTGVSGKDYCYEPKAVIPVSAGEFTIGFIPDIQNFMLDGNRNRRELYLGRMLDFFVDNRNALNIQLISFLGDLAFNTSSSSSQTIETQWKRVDEALDIFRADDMPFVVVRGNHDYQPYFDNYLPVSDFDDRSYWGGTMADSLENAYYLLSVGDQEFVILALDFHSRNAQNSEVRWANNILARYEDRYAIVISHNIVPYINDIIWENDNVFMAIMGHETMDFHWTQKSVGGRKQHLFVFDYQNSRRHKWGSVVKYFTFSPANNTVSVRTFSLTTLNYLDERDCNYNSHHQSREDRMCHSLTFELP